MDPQHPTHDPDGVEFGTCIIQFGNFDEYKAAWTVIRIDPKSQITDAWVSDTYLDV